MSNPTNVRYNERRYNALRYGAGVAVVVEEVIERPPQGELALAVVSRPVYDHILASRPTREGRFVRELRASQRTLSRRLRQ